MKVGINFVHFAWMKVGEMNRRFDFMLEKAIFNIQIKKMFNEISQTVELKKKIFHKISGNLFVFYRYQWY